MSIHSTGGDYTTVAGLVLLHLGRIPDAAGDRVEVDGWGIEVLEVGHHAITKVCLRPLPGTSGGPGAGTAVRRRPQTPGATASADA